MKYEEKKNEKQMPYVCSAVCDPTMDELAR